MSGELVLVAFAVIAFAALVAIGTRLDPSLVVSLGLASAIFSGNWGYLGLPIGVDRLIIVGGIALALIQHARRGAPWPRLRGVHLVLLAFAAYAVGSAIWVGSATQKGAAFALLDQVGIIPFLLFASAPIVFAEPRQRRVLVVVLSFTGAYLAFVGVAETVGATSVVFPRYISNPFLGIHFGRARGPFLESAAFGGALFTCAAIAILGLTLFRDRSWVRYAVAAGLMAAVFAIVGTLTRQIWLASAVTVLVTLASFAHLRRFIIPVALATALVGVGSLALVPGLSDRASARAAEERPIWDRENSNRAAVNMIEARPVLGWGWDSFSEIGTDFYEQSPNYPVTTVGKLHNVPLSFWAELGLVGLGAWIVGLLAAASGAVLRRGPPSVSAWQVSLVMIGVNWLILLNFTPFRASFTNYVVWTWLGVVGVVVQQARARQQPTVDRSPDRSSIDSVPAAHDAT